jgi:hypothetical protein
MATLIQVIVSVAVSLGVAIAAIHYCLNDCVVEWAKQSMFGTPVLSLIILAALGGMWLVFAKVYFWLSGYMEKKGLA